MSLDAPLSERRTLRLPFSEVCIHMGIAGQDFTAALTVSATMVQLYRPNGAAHSFPITRGEAGWGLVGSDHTVTDFDAKGHWYPKGTMATEAAA